jgi:excisionase family DNA binding protein
VRALERGKPPHSSQEVAAANLQPGKDTDAILSRLPDILTLEQAAGALQLGITTTRQMCRERKLPSFKVGQQWRLPRAWLVEYMNRGGHHV